MTSRARIKRDGDTAVYASPKALHLAAFHIQRKVTTDARGRAHNLNPKPRGGGLGNGSQGGVDQMKGLSKVDAATKLQIRARVRVLALFHQPSSTHHTHQKCTIRWPVLWERTQSSQDAACRVHVLVWRASRTAMPPRHLTLPPRDLGGILWARNFGASNTAHRGHCDEADCNPHIGPLGFQGRGTGDWISSDSLKKRDDMVSRVTSPCIPPPPEPKGLFETWGASLALFRPKIRKRTAAVLSAACTCGADATQRGSVNRDRL